MTNTRRCSPTGISAACVTLLSNSTALIVRALCPSWHIPYGKRITRERTQQSPDHCSLGRIYRLEMPSNHSPGEEPPTQAASAGVNSVGPPDDPPNLLSNLPRAWLKARRTRAMHDWGVLFPLVPTHGPSSDKTAFGRCRPVPGHRPTLISRPQLIENPASSTPIGFVFSTRLASRLQHAICGKTRTCYTRISCSSRAIVATIFTTGIPHRDGLNFKSGISEFEKPAGNGGLFYWTKYGT